MKNILIIIFILAPVMLPADTGSEFLLLDTSSRASGLGGAFVSRPTGLDGLQYNPSSLCSLSSLEISFQQTRFMTDTALQYAAAGKKISDLSLALSFAHYSMADISIYDLNENYINDISYRDLYTGLAAGYKLHDYSLGINLKYIYRTIADYSASGIAVDLGASRQFSIPYPSFLPNDNKKNLSAGIAVKNIGSGVKFNKEKDLLPLQVSIGADSDIIKSKFLRGALFLDLSKIIGDDFSFRSGLELSCDDLVYGRIGKSLIYNNTWSLGIGLQLPFGTKTKAQFNYSFVNKSGFDYNHSIGGIFLF